MLKTLNFCPAYSDGSLPTTLIPVVLIHHSPIMAMGLSKWLQETKRFNVLFYGNHIHQLNTLTSTPVLLIISVQLGWKYRQIFSENKQATVYLSESVNPMPSTRLVISEYENPMVFIQKIITFYQTFLTRKRTGLEQIN